MKVAIIGAGLSGLSCAYELERRGIKPTIFEKRSQVGEATGFSGIWLKQIMRCNGNPHKYLKEKYDFEIKPYSKLREVVINSPNKSTVINGNLGYTLIRGVSENSFEKQIESKINSPITFDRLVELDDIKEEFSHIVVATATPIIAKKMDVWTDTFIAHARIATVLGEFKTDSVTIWFNEKYANKAFGYLIPNSRTEATLVLLVNNIILKDLDYYWEQFISTENLEYKITQIDDIEHTCGFVNPHKIDNLYFAGNAGGFTDDLIGIGTFNAMESGILAARSIAENSDYNRLIAPIFEYIKKLHELRKLTNMLDNTGFDRLVSIVGIPGIKQFLYCNPFFKIRQLAPIARLFNKLNDRS